MALQFDVKPRRKGRRQLIGQGVSGSRIAISGVGPDQPVASNSTAEGKAQNRRVTITLTPTA